MEGGGKTKKKKNKKEKRRKEKQKRGKKKKEEKKKTHTSHKHHPPRNQPKSRQQLSRRPRGQHRPRRAQVHQHVGQRARDRRARQQRAPLLVHHARDHALLRVGAHHDAQE